MKPEPNSDAPKKSTLDLWLERKNKKIVQKGIAKKPENEPAVLSFGQERIWLIEQLYPNKNLYSYAQRYSIEGEIDIDLLIRSYQGTIERHDVIRTNYHSNDEHLIQQINPSFSLPIEQVNLEGLEESNQELELNSHIENRINLPFDLSKDPLFRIHLFVLGKKKFEMVLVMHHIMGDAWSLGIINTEASEIYKSLALEHPQNISELEIQYTDFAYWQRKKDINEEDLNYWKQKLAGDLPILNLPIKKTNNSFSFEGTSYHKKLSHGLSDKLKALAKSLNTTMFSLMLASYKVLLSKYTGQKDIIVGSPFSNRDNKQLENLVGFFNETLVLRTDLDQNSPFSKVVEQVNKNVMEALAHKSVPIETLINELKPDRKAGENPLFQTMFLYNIPQDSLTFGKDVKVESSMLDQGVSKFDLTLFVNDQKEYLELLFEYNEGFDNRLIEAMSGHLEVLLVQLLDNPESHISELSLLSENEFITLTETQNNNKKDLPAIGSIHELIHNNAVELSESVAVVFDDKSLTYHELNQWANALAHELIESGVSKNQFVGLYTKRSLEMIVGIVAILKAGGAYLPLDPTYPQERIQFMLSDANASTILVEPNSDFLSNKSSQQIIEINQLSTPNKDLPEFEFKNQLEDYAYIIYTSGSTGKPKGIPVTHKNLIHSTTARFDFYEAKMDSFLLLSSFSFDSSIAGIFWSLCSAGKLVLPPDRIEQDVNQLSEIIKNHKVTHMLMLPSLYQALLSHVDRAYLSSFVAVMVAGEACSIQLRSEHFKLLPTVKLYNEYGPTEASVWCIAHEITPSDVSQNVPIGKPISNTNAYILDQNMNPLPIGIEGELYIGGLGVTNGYLNREELTKERFLNNPFGSNEGFLYKTGDLAKFNFDGNIEFLGRVDNQIKIRGYRVELGEIKEALLSINEIEDAEVIVIEDENSTKKLAAYLVTRDQGIEQKVLSTLKSSLPAYMVPSSFSLLESFPKLPNGKVDLKHLPLPNQQLLDSNAYTPPSTEIQKSLVAIWQDVLGIEKVGIQDNFFDIGGDSILSIQIISKARKQNLFIGSSQIFDHQTIKELAANLKTKESNKSATTKEIRSTHPVKLALSHQQKAFLFHSLQSDSDQGFLQLEFNITGLVDFETLKEAWKKTIEVHEIMKTSFHWNDGESIYQKINPDAELPWDYVDLKDESKENRQNLIEQFKQTDKVKGIDLESSPVSRFTLICKAKNEFTILWSSHHILVDGWSAAIIFKDALDQYEALLAGKELSLEPVPSYGSYVDWKNTINLNSAKNYWQNMLDKANSPCFSDFKNTTVSDSNSFQEEILQLSTSTTKSLINSARKGRITINTLMQGLWMITLNDFFGQNDITIGLTVSGRGSDFDGIDRMTGLLMNVLPIRKKVEKDKSLILWLSELQKTQTELRNYEFIETDKILDWTQGSKKKALFDSLFVFGNFMKESLTVGDLVVDEFKGDFSSTFPLTIRVNPVEAFELNIRYNESIVSGEAVEWLSNRYKNLLGNIVLNGISEAVKLKNLISEKPYISEMSNKPTDSIYIKTIAYASPENQIQLDLVRIWEKVLGINTIGINDNFFDLGGNSLAAIQLFNLIENKFENKISPTALITNPTIRQLSKIISDKQESVKWSSIVPMKTSGSSNPLFCIHSGGAHVLFYKGLAKYISKDQPIYAIQPSGIDGDLPFHDSIQNMARDYIKEMKIIQPQGPYTLLGTCFSNAVGLEMAHQLKAAGEKIETLFIIDSAPAHIIPPSPNEEKKPVSRMLAMVKEGNWSGITKKFRNRYLRLSDKINSKDKSELEQDLDNMVDSLNHIYATYHWKPLDEKIVLIRSSEFSQRKDKKFHLEQWNNLASKGLEVHEVPGHHLTIFEEPEVEGLATMINKHISNKN